MKRIFKRIFKLSILKRAQLKRKLERSATSLAIRIAATVTSNYYTTILNTSEITEELKRECSGAKVREFAERQLKFHKYPTNNKTIELSTKYQRKMFNTLIHELVGALEGVGEAGWSMKKLRHISKKYQMQVIKANNRHSDLYHKYRALGGGSQAKERVKNALKKILKP
jgi:hypothetical protein